MAKVDYQNKKEYQLNLQIGVDFEEQINILVSFLKDYVTLKTGVYSSFHNNTLVVINVTK